MKCTVNFRGRDIVHTQVGRDLLERVKKLMSEVSAPESHARMEGRTLSYTLAPNKVGIEKIKAQEQREREAAAAAEAADEGEAAAKALPAPSASPETTEETERA